MTWVLALHLYYSVGTIAVVDHYPTEHECRKAMLEVVLKHNGGFDGDCYLEGVKHG